MTREIEASMTDELRHAAVLAKGAEPEAPELNMDVMQKLYDFGGLIVYRVAYFDPVMFKVTNSRVTFNENTAKAELEGLKHAGFTAGIETIMVKFDGAFSKRPNVKVTGSAPTNLQEGDGA